MCLFAMGQTKADVQLIVLPISKKLLYIRRNFPYHHCNCTMALMLYRVTIGLPDVLDSRPARCNTRTGTDGVYNAANQKERCLLGPKPPRLFFLMGDSYKCLKQNTFLQISKSVVSAEADGHVAAPGATEGRRPAAADTGAAEPYVPRTTAR